MINKQNLWFITLFSMILILGIYYVTMPKDVITKLSGEFEDTSTVLEVSESDVLIAMKVEEEEKMLSEIEKAQDILLNAQATIEEKNTAYEKLQMLNQNKGKTEELEKMLNEKYNVSSLVKIDGNNINVFLSTEDKGVEYANNIIRSVQETFSDQMYITVNFEK